jgi:hypothetical protein
MRGRCAQQDDSSIMKLALRLAFVILPLFSTGQQRVIGVFRDSFGGRLKINGDSTFHFRWLVDTQESWSQGKWTKAGDTIYLTVFQNMTR